MKTQTKTAKATVQMAGYPERTVMLYEGEKVRIKLRGYIVNGVVRKVFKNGSVSITIRKRAEKFVPTADGILFLDLLSSHRPAFAS